ncbi:MAG: L-2-hydroxyglutarate oxidase [Halobacteriales archaeon]
MERYDVAVVGGGCVGCATALHLAEASDRSVAVVEKEHHLARHQSGRNSGVLHPGFNYEPGSLKARFATEGTARLKAFAAEHDVPLSELGVVVVAQNADEEARLETLQSQADANGVETELLGPDELSEREPHADGMAALYCPEAASVDSVAYVHALAREAEAAGVEFFRGYEVRGFAPTDDGHVLETTGGDLEAGFVVNAAGLYADRLAHRLGVGERYRVVPFRGEYYELVPDRRELCRSMIYPTPDPELPFLGVHYTRRTDGKVIVGPNAVLAFGREAYRPTAFDLRELAGTLGFPGFWRLLADRKLLGVAAAELHKSYRKEAFVAAARKLVPTARSADFRRSYAGVRAQLVRDDGALVDDPLFVDGPRSLHVLNAVSPGLTSSLPVGEHLAERVVAAAGD